MKLSKFTIRNYRGIKELSIDLENISVIIGPNNSCKSTILEALKQFSSNTGITEDDYYNHDTSQPISFHATFTDLTEEELDRHGIRNSIHEESNNYIVRAIYRFGQQVERVSKVCGPETHDLGEEGWTGRLGGGRNNSNFISCLPKIIYIPAVKDANETLKDKSDQMTLLSTLYNDLVQRLPEFREAEEKTQLLKEKINQHDDPNIKLFEAEVQQFLKEVTSTRIKFNVNVKPLDQIFSTSIEPQFSYNGVDTKLKYQGSGVQRTFIVSLFKGYHNYLKQNPRNEREDKRQLIIALEEPELYLHPHLARIFKDTLYNLADEGFFQIIATTHSPNFIDLSKPNRTLIKLSFDENKQVKLNRVNSDIFGLPKDEKERFQALLKFNPYVNETFFADRVILVEGDTEVIACKLIGEKLVDAGELDMDSYRRTSVVNCFGKTTMYVLLNVLNNFNIPYTVIHDYDITEYNDKGQRRSVASLKRVLTENHKLEEL